MERLRESGDVYRGTYAGWYCSSCERIYAEDELDDELDEFAPLDDRFEALQVAGLPAGAVARRALLLVLAEEDGASPRFALYGAAPEEELDYPYIDDIEELGLLRSQERRLRLDLAW